MPKITLKLGCEYLFVIVALLYGVARLVVKVVILIVLVLVVLVPNLDGIIVTTLLVLLVLLILKVPFRRSGDFRRGEGNVSRAFV